MNQEKKKKEKMPKPKYNMWQNSWFMIKLAWTSKEKKVLILSFLSGVLALLISLINLYVTPVILSKIETNVSITELIITILLFVGALMIVSASSTYINENIQYGKISVRLEIINLLNKKSCTTSYPNVHNDEFKKLLNKADNCTNSNMASTESIWGTLTKLLTDVLGFIIYVLLLSSFEPILIVVILATTLISYFVGKYVNKYGYKHRDEVSETYKQMNYIGNQMKQSAKAKDIKIFGLKPWLTELYDKALSTYVAFQKKAEGVYIWAKIVDLVMTFLRNAIAYAYLINLVLNNGLSISEFLLVFNAVGGFSTWMVGILGGLNTLHKESLDICSVRECLEFEELFKFENGEHIEVDDNKVYELRLNNVSFKYPGAENNTLNNINLTLHPGEKLAIVGLNGAGKTTLIKLMCGLLDPTEGEVLLNGKDIRDYNRSDFYKMFSAVFQDFSLLAGSITLNIAQSEDDIDMERIKDCATMAGLKKKIESLDNGYNTLLNRDVYEDAILLSGGETQRLMLARALYKNGYFVFLDEPTAALDPIAEAEMYQKYNDITNCKSSVYISHRLASTRFCDRIIMISDGIIKEEGTHEELLKLGGKYFELYEIQSKYYKEGENDDEER